jgi:hypothetical protein
MIARIFRTRIENKTEDVHEENQFQFGRGERSRNATGMPGILPE